MSKERELLNRARYNLDREYCADLIDEIQELLAQPEQEPVAWLHEGLDETGEPVRSIYHHFYEHANLIPLYTAPPKREPLSDEEVYSIGNKYAFHAAVREIERIHGIGGGE
jgi:hypothetical protein